MSEVWWMDDKNNFVYFQNLFVSKNFQKLPNECVDSKINEFYPMCPKNIF